MTATQKLFEVFKYWRRMSQVAECQELLLVAQINRQAVIDYLRDPDMVGYYNRGAWRSNLLPSDRKSAYEWIFGDLDCECDLAYLCGLVGPQVYAVRLLIVEAALEKGMIPKSDTKGCTYEKHN